MLGKNRLKEILEEGRLAVGSCVYSSSPALVELAGFCGLDFCRIDNEHSWRRDKSAENMMRAAAVSGIVPLLRVDRDGIGSLCFSARWGTEKTMDWIGWSHDEQLIGIMIEDYRAIDNLDEIMSVEELDYVLFGASDYSVSIGLPGETGHPKVMEAFKKTIKSAGRHGKYVCKGVGFPWAENAKKYVDMGCHMIELGHDVTILRTIWKTKGDAIRKLGG